MQLSARNQFEGTVSNINKGAVNGIVTLDIDGSAITATISLGSIESLGLTVGSKATAIIKATEVMIGVGAMKLSARNQLAGKISGIQEGAVNAIVTVAVSQSINVSATISMASVKALELAVGKDVVAVIKATSVIIGC
jgi:molybdate transport system regulatory protein